jgi:hypothetical protein
MGEPAGAARRRADRAVARDRLAGYDGRLTRAKVNKVFDHPCLVTGGERPDATGLRATTSVSTARSLPTWRTRACRARSSRSHPRRRRPGPGHPQTTRRPQRHWSQVWPERSSTSPASVSDASGSFTDRSTTPAAPPRRRQRRARHLSRRRPSPGSTARPQRER